MRREERPLPGGTPILLLYPESDSERRLSPIERSALEAAANDSRIRPADRPALLAGIVESREFNGYGAYIHLRAATGLTLPEIRGLCAVGLHVPWRSSPLVMVLFSESNGELTLEFFPIDGENWSVEEVERVLLGDSEQVEIRSTGL